MLAADLGVRINGEEQALIDEVKSMERAGFQFENAEGTLELMLRRKQPDYRVPFNLIHIMVVASDRLRAGMNAEAMIKLQVDGELVHTAAEGADQCMPSIWLEEGLVAALSQPGKCAPG